ncbi:hypothetical protein [Bacillus sp. ISL-57]|uniref:hypothetical protein n=1 Tax=Bacillus sp. ISL-57 TaxID=2819135 RepID=UPI001BEACAE1|nr:hypothetical protein [Bacillus sp. ISL-57]MBT2717549.1 hypothetical protein [Bacillus sp. ISL-57]
MTKRKEVPASEGIELEPLENQEETLDTAPKTESTELVIYIGESLKNGKLEQFTVFNNGIPEFLAEDIEKCPAINSLILPISQLGESRRKLTIQGTMEHTLNSQITQYVRSEN